MSRVQKVYFGGIPTEPDVRRIRERFPDDQLVVGQVIPYSEVATIIQAPYRSARFVCVTQRWRILVEKDRGLVIGVEKSEGFKVLDDHQKLDLSGDKLRTAVKQARRSFTLVGMVDRRNLSDEERSRMEHYNNRSAAMISVAQRRSAGTTLPSLV